MTTPRKLHIKSYGCQMNVYDAQRMVDTLAPEGFVETASAEDALDAMLGKIADFYEEEVESSIRGMTSLIEPIMMVGLGGMIAFILVAMYLPIFQLGDTIG